MFYHTSKQIQTCRSKLHVFLNNDSPSNTIHPAKLRKQNGLAKEFPVSTKSKLVILAVFSVLSACSGGSSGSDGTVTSEFVGTPLIGFEYLEGVDRFFIAFVDQAGNTSGGTFVDRNNDPRFEEPAGFRVYHDAMAQPLAVIGETPSGNGRATVYTGGTELRTGALLERSAPFDRPTTDSVTYQGHYLGVFRTIDGVQFPRGTIGLTEITANFGTGMVGGSITSRETNGDTVPTSMGNVALFSTTFEGDTFSGISNGGEFNLAGFNADFGRYEGVFVSDDNGAVQEVVGAVEIIHTRDNGQGPEPYAQEVGVFILD